MKRNGDMGPHELWRVSTFGRNYKENWVSMLMGKSNREVIDGATREPDIPQILFLMNGLGIPEDAPSQSQTPSSYNTTRQNGDPLESNLGATTQEDRKTTF